MQPNSLPDAADLIARYIASHPATWASSRKFRHLCNAWRRHGNPPVTTEGIEQFRKSCRACGLRSTTYETQISDLISAARYAGLNVSAGHRDRRPRPVPNAASLDGIAEVYRSAPPWAQQFIALTYWTCLRRSDALRLMCDSSLRPTHVLRYTASKTGKQHVWPVPHWLRRHLSHIAPFDSPTDYRRKQLAAILRPLTPQQIRRRGLTEWSRADGTAGRIVHGCGLGVLSHYIDPLTILEEHQHKVRLPDAFCSAEEQQQQADISLQFKRLDPEAQSLVRQTIQRLA